MHVQLPPEIRLHPVLHTSNVKHHEGLMMPKEQPVFETASSEVFEVESIVGHRFVKGILQLLVHWKGYNSFEDTWEPQGNLSGA